MMNIWQLAGRQQYAVSDHAVTSVAGDPVFFSFNKKGGIFPHFYQR